MIIVFEAEAEEQLYDIAEVIDDRNMIGAGERWVINFIVFIKSYAKSNTKYAVCKNARLAELQYSCLTFNHKWVIAFKLVDDEMRIYEILYGPLLT
jgi:hypothetical protein